MPTSGTAASRVRPSARLSRPCGTASNEVGGGQSAVGQPEVLPPEPATAEVSTLSETLRAPSGASSALGFGLVA